MCKNIISLEKHNQLSGVKTMDSSFKTSRWKKKRKKTPSIKNRIKWQKTIGWEKDMRSSEEWDWWAVDGLWIYARFFSTSTKCTCVPTHGTEVSVSVAWVRGEGVGGLGIPLVPWLPQELRVNWSCSMGFLTQAPRPALWKALMSACLAEWYSVAACLASW